MRGVVYERGVSFTMVRPHAVTSTTRGTLYSCKETMPCYNRTKQRGVVKAHLCARSRSDLASCYRDGTLYLCFACHQPPRTITTYQVPGTRYLVPATSIFYDEALKSFPNVYQKAVATVYVPGPPLVRSQQANTLRNLNLWSTPMLGFVVCIFCSCCADLTCLLHTCLSLRRKLKGPMRRVIGPSL